MELQTQFTQAVQQSVSDILNTMIPMAQSTFQNETIPQELVGTINISGEWSGSISIGLPYQLAIEMASILIEEPIQEVNEDVYEAVAEITNMVAGGIKSNLSKTYDVFKLGLPQVLDLGPKVIPSHAIPFVQVPIATEKGSLLVQSHVEHKEP